MMMFFFISADLIKNWFLVGKIPTGHVIILMLPD